MITLLLASTGGIQLSVITNDTVLEEGQTALLSCVAYGPTDLQFNWTFDGELEYNSSLVATYRMDTFVLGTRFQQFFLQVCSVEPEHSGTYTCMVGNGNVSLSSSLELTVLG